MKLLLDTHTALWWWSASPRLSAVTVSALSDPEHDVFFSSASAYEIFQKVRLGRLEVPTAFISDLPGAVRAEGWLPAVIELADAAIAAMIDHAHRDPFDRLLAAQCRSAALTIVSADPFFREIGVDVLW